MRKVTMKRLSIVTLLSVLMGVSTIASAQTNFLRNANTNGVTAKKTMVTGSDRVYYDRGVTVTVIAEELTWPNSVSNDKTCAALQSFDGETSFVWSATNGLVYVDGTCSGASDLGVIAGRFKNENNDAVAGVWYPDMQAWQFLGLNPDFQYVVGCQDYSSAWNMTNDADVVVGLQFSDAFNAYAFKYMNGEYTMLETPANSGSRANNVSDDAEVVGGWYTDENGYWVPAVWDNGSLIAVAGEFGDGEVLGVSSNGEWAVGYLNGVGFRWNRTTGETEMIENTVDMNESLMLSCVSDNGTAFGYTMGFMPMVDGRFAVVLTPDGELLPFAEYAEIRGMADASDWAFYSIGDATPDANSVVGIGMDPDGNQITFLMDFGEELCGAPSGLTYQIENVNDVVLSWVAPENAEGVTYEVYTDATSTEALATGLENTTWTDTDKITGKYTYVVRANWSDTCISLPSNKVFVVVNNCIPENMCDMVFEMADEYGDGWNGASISVIVNDSELAKVNLSEGSEGVENVSLCTGEEVRLVWNAGDYDEEITFVIKDAEGEVIYDSAEQGIQAGELLVYNHDCPGIDVIELAEESVSVYPNPATTQVSVKGENINSIEVYSMMGQLVKVVSSDLNGAVISTSDLSGSYLFRVISNDGQVSTKIVEIVR